VSADDTCVHRTPTIGFGVYDVSRLVYAGCLAVVQRVEVVCVALTTAVVELAATGRSRVVVPSDLVGDARTDVDRQLTVSCHVTARHQPRVNCRSTTELHPCLNKLTAIYNLNKHETISTILAHNILIILVSSGIYNFASKPALTYFILRFFQDSGNNVFSHITARPIFVNRPFNKGRDRNLIKNLYLFK